MSAALTGWLVGLLLGMRHALEPDHLTAVCTLVGQRAGARRGLWLGAWWGLGHSLSLLAVGTLLALLQAQLPARLAAGFEVAVAVMLVLLGARAISRGLGDGHEEHQPARRQDRLATRSLVVGVVHGLAGSGALTALVLAELPSTASRIGYIALFGCGSMLGMALLSGVAGWPLARLMRSPRAASLLALTTGVISIGFGLFFCVRVLRG